MEHSKVCPNSFLVVLNVDKTLLGVLHLKCEKVESEFYYKENEHCGWVGTQHITVTKLQHIQPSKISQQKSQNCNQRYTAIGQLIFKQ